MLADAANLDDTRTNRPKPLSPRRGQPSLKTFPDDFLDLTETILYLKNCRINVKRPRGPLKCFLRFVKLGNTRRKKLIFFSLKCLLFYLKIFCFPQPIRSLRIDILFAPNLLENFVERDKNVMDVCKTRYYEKKKDKSVFFSPES